MVSGASLEFVKNTQGVLIIRILKRLESCKSLKDSGKKIYEWMADEGQCAFTDWRIVTWRGAAVR
jgi:hypothetical protein